MGVTQGQLLAGTARLVLAGGVKGSQMLVKFLRPPFFPSPFQRSPMYLACWKREREGGRGEEGGGWREEGVGWRVEGGWGRGTSAHGLTAMRRALQYQQDERTCARQFQGGLALSTVCCVRANRSGAAVRRRNTQLQHDGDIT